MKSCLVRLNKESKALYDGIKGESIVTIKDFVLVPNGRDNPVLVCVIYAQREDGGIVSATSDKFKALDEEQYEEFYPTPHMFKFENK
jgi:hypothetical protein